VQHLCYRLPSLQHPAYWLPASNLRRYLHVPNPMYDYVAPELVSLFVTDTGGYQGSYVYRLLAEYYTRDDYNLSEDFLDQLVYSS
jgi:translation initiation factor 2B subunit (eIF-2B alpha/beta/delta family)